MWLLADRLPAAPAGSSGPDFRRWRPPPNPVRSPAARVCRGGVCCGAGCRVGALPAPLGAAGSWMSFLRSPGPACGTRERTLCAGNPPPKPVWCSAATDCTVEAICLGGALLALSLGWQGYVLLSAPQRQTCALGSCPLCMQVLLSCVDEQTGRVRLGQRKLPTRPGCNTLDCRR